MAHDNTTNQPTAEERRALFFHHFRKIDDATRKMKEADAERKRLRKLAKADGIAIGDLDYALKIAAMEDTDAVVDELKRRTEIARWLALPVEFQADLFGVDSAAEDRAYDEGRVASATGKGVNPYEKTLPQHGKWNEGFSDDQKRMQEALRASMDAANEAATKSTNAATRKGKAAAAGDDSNVVALPTDGTKH